MGTGDEACSTRRIASDHGVVRGGEIIVPMRPRESPAVQSQMRRLNVDWHFHDLRAKTATDAQHAILGKHSTLGTYLRAERTKPVI
jgi:hypothetical protein